MKPSFRVLVIAQGLRELQRHHFVGALLHYWKEQGVSTVVKDLTPGRRRGWGPINWMQFALGLELASNVRLLASLRRLQPTHVLVVKGTHLQPWLLEEIRTWRERPFLACVNTDDPLVGNRGGSSANVRRSVSLYDAYFVWSRRLVAAVQEVGGSPVLLPFAADTDLITPAAGARTRYPFAFVANADSVRQAQINGIAASLRNKGYGEVYLHGKGWKKTAGSVVQSSAEGGSFVELMAASSINLNLLRDQNKGATNLRTFEIPATATLMLHEASAEAAEYFRDGVEAVYFSSDEEAADKAHHYLTRSGDRAAIASRGYERLFSAGLTYRARFQELADALEGMAR